MRTLGLLILLSFSLVGPARAGALYRCVGSDGIPNYSSKRVSNAVCSVVANTASTPRVSTSSQPSKRPAAAAPAATTATSAPLASSGSRPADTTKLVVFNTATAGATLLPANVGAGVRVTRGSVYKYEIGGITHYTNVRPAGAMQVKVLFSYIETCYACAPLPGVNFGTLALNTGAYRAEIQAASQQYGVEEAIIRAIIHAESSFRANARSYKGAQGLMQLIPATAARFGVADAFDPAQNIKGGVQYLSWLMQRYSSNLSLVAAAYNAGEGAVDRNGGVPPYSETQRYVQRVGQLADRYRSALAGP